MNDLNPANIPQDVLLAIVASTLLILLLVTGITIAFYLNGRERIRQKMLLIETKLAFEEELRKAESEVSESIMAYLAQELHDNIGQLLTALHIQVENLKLDHPQMTESFKPSEIYITEINQQLRLLSRTLNNDYIGHIGLLGALQVETSRLNSLRRLTVHFEAASGPSNLEKNQELMVFRIFQEISQNALRHAKAKNLYVKAMTDEGNFRLEIRDDGQGFDTGAVLASDRSSGLRNITKRAELAGLLLTIESSPGKGSLFIIKKRDKLG